MIFYEFILLNLNFLLIHRNKYSEGMDDGQKTSRGHSDFNYYVKILCVFIFQTDGQMNRQTEKLIQCGLGNLIGSSRYQSKTIRGNKNVS